MRLSLLLRRGVAVVSSRRLEGMGRRGEAREMSCLEVVVGGG